MGWSDWLFGSASHPVMEKLYWLSQIGLLIAGVWAGIAAFRQISTLKLFELLKFLQDENFRHSRRVVITEIDPLQDTSWWDDPKLEACASTCCGHYDIVGNILIYSRSKRLQDFFIEHWAESMVRTYSILQPFIERRRTAEGNYYTGYEWLFVRAKRFRPHVGGPWPPIKSDNQPKPEEEHHA